jgi:hypothetical protein
VNPDRIWVRWWPNGAASVHTEPYDGAIEYEVVEESPDGDADERNEDE